MSPVPAARGLFAVLALALCLGVIGVPVTPAAAADEPGLLRIAHLSPDTPAVDVAVAPLPPDDAPLIDPGPDLVTGLGYGGVGEFSGVPAGGYAVSLRAAGSPASAPPMLSARVDVAPGGAVTVALIGTFAELALEALPEDLSPPPPGSARVRVLAAAAGAESLDLAHEGGPVLASGLPFGGAGERVVLPSGRAVLRVDDGRGVGELPTDLAAGSVATVLVLDRPGGGLAVRVVVDAAAPALVPAGGVEAGGGSPMPWPGWAVAALGLGAAAVRDRRRLVVLSAGLVVAALVPGPVVAAAADPRPVVLAAEAANGQPAPIRVRVPAAGIDAPLDAVGLDPAGALAVPADGTRAGWFADGTAPGARGPAVLTGHVDGGGAPAVFARLGELRPGNQVLVDRADGTTLRFVVTRVARHPKIAFPTAAVYGPTPGPELRLITCGGAFDRASGSYVDNVVVYAAPA